MKKIGVFLAEGLEEIEGLTVVDLLRRVNVDVTMVSISGKKEVVGSHGITIIADTEYENTAFDSFDGVVLPGGMPGTINLKNHAGVNEVIKGFAAKGKIVAAICAAPSVLGNAGLLEGKKATIYPGMEAELTGADPCTDQVVKDGNIITSRGMGTAIPFALELVSCLVDQETARKLAVSVVYKEES